MKPREQVKSIISDGIKTIRTEKAIFEKEFLTVSNRIAANKLEMDRRLRERNLIRNK